MIVKTLHFHFLSRLKHNFILKFMDKNLRANIGVDPRNQRVLPKIYHIIGQIRDLT